MRECPVNERCLARESCNRICNLRSITTSAKPPRAYKNMVVIAVFLGSNLWRRTVLQSNDTEMTVRAMITRVVQQEDLNFLLTNRIPRRLLTHFTGWLSRLEHPLVTRSCIALWRLFSAIDLSERRGDRFQSRHERFIRRLAGG